MAPSSRPPANNFVRVARKVYNPIGFSKGYNFILFFIFAGAWTGFVLARLAYIDFNVFCPSSPGQRHGKLGAVPGECYWDQFPRFKTGIIMHLATILPAGLLVVLQFIPTIRYKAIWFHRINGYVIILLALISIGSVLAISERSFDGSLVYQTLFGLLSFASAAALILAYVNVKRLQIEQHRAWMLRAWFWMATIITARIIAPIAAAIVSTYGPDKALYVTYSCEEIRFMLLYDNEFVASKYPLCGPADAPSPLPPDLHVAVLADSYGTAENVGAVATLVFSMSTWLALVMHAVGIELYLKFTPAESERLRRVSYRKQLERGMKNPGSAGLVIERFGDAEPWQIPEPEVKKVSDAEPWHVSEPEIRKNESNASEV